MASIIPLASGKGGVGKTVVTANLGYTLARRGKKTIIADLDLGGANLHTLLGVKNRHAGIGHYIYTKGVSLPDYVVDTGHDNLRLIPGDSLLPGTANLNYFKKVKLLRDLKKLDADYILLDLGAGSSNNMLDFFSASMNGILVSSPEPTSILNAYSFIKNTLFRAAYRTFKARSEEREKIKEFMLQKIEGTSITFFDLIEIIEQVNPDSAELLRQLEQDFLPRVVINMGRNADDLHLGTNLRMISRKNLGINVHYVGFLPYDREISKSVIKKELFISSSPDSPFSVNMEKLADMVESNPVIEAEILENDIDIQELAEDPFFNTGFDEEEETEEEE